MSNNREELLSMIVGTERLAASAAPRVLSALAVARIAFENATDGIRKWSTLDAAAREHYERFAAETLSLAKVKATS